MSSRDPLSPGPSARQPQGSLPAEAAGAGHGLRVNFGALLRVTELPRSPSQGGGALPALLGSRIYSPAQPRAPWQPRGAVCLQRDGLPSQQPLFLAAAAAPLHSCLSSHQWARLRQAGPRQRPGSSGTPKLSAGEQCLRSRSGIVYCWSRWHEDSSPGPATTTQFVLIMQGGKRRNEGNVSREPTGQPRPPAPSRAGSSHRSGSTGRCASGPGCG